MNHVVIEPATAEDLDELSDLLGELFSEESDFRPNKEKQLRGLRLIFEQPNRGRVFVLRRDHSIVGMINLLFTISTAEGGFVILLEDLVIHKSFRDHGYGSQLLEYAIDFARKKNFLRIGHDSDAPAHHAGNSAKRRNALSGLQRTQFRRNNSDAKWRNSSFSFCGDSCFPAFQLVPGGGDLHLRIHPSLRIAGLGRARVHLGVCHRAHSRIWARTCLSAGWGNSKSDRALAVGRHCVRRSAPPARRLFMEHRSWSARKCHPPSRARVRVDAGTGLTPWERRCCFLSRFELYQCRPSRVQSPAGLSSRWRTNRAGFALVSIW